MPHALDSHHTWGVNMWSARKLWPLVLPAVFIAPTVACDTTLGDSGQRVCDLVSNDRCQPGEMCIDATNERCVPAGIKALNDACAEDTDCVASAVCAGDPGERVCRTKCSYTNSNCATGLQCFRHEATETPDHLGFCAPPICDPIANEGCPSDKVCVSGVKPTCGAAGSGTAGTACVSTADCGAQLTCQQKSCRRLCYGSKTASDNPCANDETCVPLLDADGEELMKDQGYCKAPCNAVTDEGCGDNLACYGSSSEVPPQCGAYGAAKRNDFCPKPTNCTKGTICVPISATQFKCKTKCDASKSSGDGKNPGCPPSKTCIELKDGKTGKKLPNSLGACGP